MRIETETRHEEAREPEKKEVASHVRVKCLGISCPTGFQLDPVGYAPSFVTFMPGETLVLAKHYSDYLVAQDKHRFVVVKK